MNLDLELAAARKRIHRAIDLAASRILSFATRSHGQKKRREREGNAKIVRLTRGGVVDVD